MNIAVVSDTGRPTPASRTLLKAVKRRGFKAYYIQVDVLSARIGDAARVYAGGVSLSLDGMFLRSLGKLANVEQLLSHYAIFKQLELSGVVVVNRVDGLLTARNKYLTLLRLAQNGIRVPPTLLTENPVLVHRHAEYWGEAIVKPILGSRGYGSVKVCDPDVAYQISRTLLENKMPVMLQRFVENPGRDIRAFVIGGRVVAAMYRYPPPGGWKANIAQGGRGEACRLSEEAENTAVKSVEALDLDYAGVDMLEGRDGLTVIEVNGSADFEELTRVSGVDIPGLLVSHIIEKIKR